MFRQRPQLLRAVNATSQWVRSMFVQSQNTPNPLALKFLPGKEVLGENSNTTIHFSNAEEAKVSPLAQRLFRIEGVTHVFLASDFVTVTKIDDDERADWATLKPLIFENIMEHYSSGRPVIKEDAFKQAAGSADQEEDDEVVSFIKELLDTRIRPMVQEDGGDITFVAFEEGVVKLKLQGSCTGCPSSSVTLKSGIENMLQFYVPEVQTVEEVKDEADDLIEREFQRLEKQIGEAEAATYEKWPVNEQQLAASKLNNSSDKKS